MDNHEEDERAQMYRLRSAEMKALAARAPTQRDRMAFIALAESWNRLADELEHHSIAINPSEIDGTLRTPSAKFPGEP